MRDQLSDEPCQNCLEAWHQKHILLEAIMRLPKMAPALDMEGNPECWDCAGARTVLKLNPAVPGWGAARTVTESYRREMYRLPSSVWADGAARLFMYPRGDYTLQDHHAWMEQVLMPLLGIDPEEWWGGEKKEKPDDAGAPAG